MKRDRLVQSTGGESTPLEIISHALKSVMEAKQALSALADYGWVCVPKIPTKEMIEAAWADALAESAPGVWESMIEVVEHTA